MTALRKGRRAVPAGAGAGAAPSSLSPPRALLATAAVLGLRLPSLPPGSVSLLAANGPAQLGLSQGSTQLSLGLEEATSELDKALPDIDSHWRDGLTEQHWGQGECTKLARRISLVGLGPVAGEPKRRNVHTGMILREGKDGAGASPLLGRKMRLAVMSFLATQDLTRTRLHIWADVDTNSSLQMLKDVMEPVLARKDLAHSVHIKRFNASREFPKVSQNSGRLLLSLYNSVEPTALAQKSDLERACILYNYGGMWLDSDVLLIQDMSPLMDRDFAYFGEKGLINNAVLSTSSPRSLFASSYLLTLVQQNLNADGSAATGEYFRYGPKILSLLWGEEWTRRTFHVLPTCFFDATWSREPGMDETRSPWDDFFSKSLAESTEMKQELAYLYPLNSGREFFAYHWHGRWGVPISNQSLAWALERIYWSKLNLTGAP